MRLRRHPDTETLRQLALAEACEAPLRRHVAGCSACSREIRLVRVLASSRMPYVAPCPDEITLVLAAEERLPRDAQATTRRHLGGCVSCTALFESVRGARIPRATGPGLGGARRLAQRAGVALRAAADGAAEIVAAVKALARPELPISLVIATRSAAGVSASAGFVEGMAAYRAGRHAEARRCLERALAGGDASPECHFFLAACLRRENLVAEAIEHLRRAVEARPSVPEYRWHLAQSLLAAGEGHEAVAELERVARAPGARRASAREQLRSLKTLLAAG